MSEKQKRPLTDAKKRANAEFEKKAYDKVLVRVEAGKLSKIKDHATKFQQEEGAIGTAGYTPKGSVNGFINRAIDETIQRDTNPLPQTTQSSETPKTPQNGELIFNEVGYDPMVKKPLYIEKNTGKQYIIEQVDSKIPIEDNTDNELPW